MFNHGACHIFAIELHRIFGYPIIRVTSKRGSHDHLACSPEEGIFLDYFGWFRRRDYEESEGIADLGIIYHETCEAKVRERFIEGDGSGYYSEPAFVEKAKEMAQKWIERYRSHFDGTTKEPIPGLCRIKSESDPTKIFD